MDFSFVIPGQPPSLNHSYRPVLLKRADGTVRMGVAKVKGLEQWQTSVSYIVRLAKPHGFPDDATELRLAYQFFYHRRFDADNALKALNDAIAHALGVDDDIFLPCVLSKVKDLRDPRTEVTVSY